MKIGFIDYYLDEWHANNYPLWLKEATDGRVEVAYAYALKDAEGGMTTECWCRENGIKQCKTEAELIELSDAIVVLSPDNCELHEQLSYAALASGKRTYIDKTFAPTLEAARRIFKQAEKYNTPVWSSSALRFAAEYKNAPSNITAISSWGPMNYEIYSIHQLEPVMMLMGVEAESVCYSESDNFYSLAIRFTDGRYANINGFQNGSPFCLNIAGDENAVLSADEDFFAEFIKALADFFENGSLPVDSTETLKIMAVREAGLKAAKAPGEWIKTERV